MTRIGTGPAHARFGFGAPHAADEGVYAIHGLIFVIRQRLRSYRPWREEHQSYNLVHNLETVCIVSEMSANLKGMRTLSAQDASPRPAPA